MANAGMLALNIMLGAGLVVSAYSGCESPIDTPILGVVVLTFPAWLAAVAAILVADIIWWRKTSLVAIAALAAAWPMVWNTCPLNIGAGIENGTKPERIFTLLTYNVCNLKDATGKYPGDVNPTISYILRTDADIVCLQELKMLEQLPEKHIGKAQLDSLHERYPYILLSGYAMAVLSKHPLTNLHLDVTSREPGNYCDVAGVVAEIEGHRLAIFSVHLQSYSLSKDDKATYRDLTRLRTDEDLHEIRNTLLYKLELAAMHRAKQAAMLGRYVDYYGGENVIVCGDFNDVPGCYTLRTLAEHGLREVWPAVGFGPTYTYNDNRFYFRIDHVLWRGELRPAGINRGNVRYSDHYPLLTTFVWDESEPTTDNTTNH